MTYFDGFSKDAVIFLKKLKENNNRDWFYEHKETYENKIKSTAQTFIEEMGHVFASEGLKFTADTKKSLFRIYKDMRFGKDKLPYKTHIGMFFPYGTSGRWLKPVEATGLYLHIEPHNTFIAGGLYSPQPAHLRGIRNKIAIDYDEFLEIISDKKIIQDFEQILEDEKLKRVPAGFPKEHPAAELLKLKRFTVLGAFDEELIYDRRLIDIVKSKAETMTPFLDFLHQGAFGDTNR